MSDRDTKSENWQPTNWRPRWRPRQGMPLDDLQIDAVGGGRYAVRSHGLCLTKRGTWEYEPLPSGRDEDFFRRCRFGTLAAAQRAADRAIAAVRR